VGVDSHSGAWEVELDILDGPLRSLYAAEYEGVCGILADLLQRGFTRAQLIHTQNYYRN
jgi:hypothetical protein